MDLLTALFPALLITLVFVAGVVVYLVSLAAVVLILDGEIVGGVST